LIIQANSNKFSCGIHFFKVLVQIHYSATISQEIQTNLRIEHISATFYGPIISRIQATYRRLIEALFYIVVLILALISIVLAVILRETPTI
jgi:hypothetical protein